MNLSSIFLLHNTQKELKLNFPEVIQKILLLLWSTWMSSTETWKWHTFFSIFPSFGWNFKFSIQWTWEKRVEQLSKAESFTVSRRNCQLSRASLRRQIIFIHQRKLWNFKFVFSELSTFSISVLFKFHSTDLTHLRQNTKWFDLNLNRLVNLQQETEIFQTKVACKI